MHQTQLLLSRRGCHLYTENPVSGADLVKELFVAPIWRRRQGQQQQVQAQANGQGWFHFQIRYSLMERAGQPALCTKIMLREIARRKQWEQVGINPLDQRFSALLSLTVMITSALFIRLV